jgi:glycosyltransferase involved in cell wall biosynthesis
VTSRPRIAVLAGFWPAERLDNAGSLTVRHRVNTMQQHADITLVVREQLGVTPYQLGVDPAVRVMALRTPEPAGRLVPAVTKVSTGDLSLGRVITRAWAEQLSEHAGEFDAVEVHWSQHFGLVDEMRRIFPGAVLVAYAHDVMTQSLQRRGERAPGRGSRVVARIAARRAREREPRVINRFDSVVTFSEKDRRLLEGMGVRVPVVVEQLYFELPEVVSVSTEPRVVFAGAMQRRENDEAARWLIREIWPAVRTRVPAAQLTIAGSSPSASLRAAASACAGVTVTGYVEDLASVYRQASLVVAPLLTGAGVKLKVIDAWASGLPVVATTVGAEGLPATLFGAVTDDPAEFSDRVAELLVDEPARHRLREAGRAWAEAAHDRLDHDVSASLSAYRSAAATIQRE